MMTLTLLLAALAQEPRIETLVQRLDSDDVAVADDAETAIVKLGPAALPALKDALAKVPSTAKPRLERAVARIERGVKLEKAQGQPVVVTLKGEIALAEALDKLGSLGAAPIQTKGALPASRVSLAFDKTPFWDALDGVCRAHGGVMWRVDEDGVTVQTGPWRACPRVARGSLTLIFDHLSATKEAVRVHAFAAWTRGSRPRRVTLTIDSAQDEEGRKLAAREGVFFSLRTPAEVSADNVAQELVHPPLATAGARPKKLSRLAGRVTAHYVLDRKTEAAFGIADVSCVKDVGAWRVTLAQADVDKSYVSIIIDACGPAAEVPWEPYDFVVVDADGKSHPLSGSLTPIELADKKTGLTYTLRVSLPAGAVPARIELRAPADVAEVVVPFELRDVPLDAGE